MTKFKPGETSCEVLDKKRAITKSILTKSKHIDRIKTCKDIPPSLKVKGNYISRAAVHSWSDDQFGVISYCRNAAHSKHNNHALNVLIESIENANRRLSSAPNIESEKHGKTSTRLSEDAVYKLRSENEYLRVALAEVYRAYMQLLDSYREDKEIDEAFRRLIKEQARVLGKNRVWGAK
ncbi:hypothetical protein SAMN04488540_12332 [Ferrimonas sediminum]|uniref:Uncharacterized protein n=1 Tax=Ferrimonas sediminum TaxID=718193 RepID=A0A1G9AGG0_9GAMM|nr:hypothetical protein [Ferrimonas sediminum]SDK26368.1 hypothetical protein SAMN04488540_12332 [Ferrimonas sediminum]